MLYSFSRRLQSTLIKSEVPADIGKVVAQSKGVVEIQDYQTSALKDYFDQDGLLVPIETIRERSDAKDFEYFLTRGNFLKVVDTLEKYQQRVVNTQSDSGKEFVLFKRQLYQMYEVQNRSIDEHDTFSLTLERQNLRWLYKANLDYISEVQRVTHLDNLVQHGALKGAVFKAKMLSQRRLRGLCSFTLAGLAYANLTTLSLMMGPTVPMLGIVAAAIQGMRSFAEAGTISKIEYVKEGEHKGLLRMTIQKSPLVSYGVIVNPRFTKSLCAVGEDDLGEDDTEGNVIYAEEYLDESTGQRFRDGVFTLPADSYRDKTTMEWVMAVKEDCETDSLYNELIIQKHHQVASTGGITGLKKLVVQQTGYADFGDEEELNLHLKKRSDDSDDVLVSMTETYGADKLEKMSPGEFYRLYKDYYLSRQ